jgi:hypothetical protein
MVTCMSLNNLQGIAWPVVTASCQGAASVTEAASVSSLYLPLIGPLDP